jgi:hypothetical protein
VNIKEVVTFLLPIVSISSFCLAAGTQTTAISLDQAVRQGKVEVEVLSLGGPTGNTVRVNVRRKGQETVRVSITPGTVFLTTADRQNMTGGSIQGEFTSTSNSRYNPTSVMVLADNARHGYLVQSFCLDYHKPAPKSGDTFSLAIHDERAMRILQSSTQIQASPWAVQCAIWMDRTGVTAGELKNKFPTHVTDVEISTARKLLAAAEKKGVEGLPAGMAPEVRVEAARIFSPDPAVRAKAVEVLAGMGQQAAPAVSILAANVINIKADHHLPPAVVQVGATAGNVVEQLENSGIAAVGPWIRALRESGALADVDVNIAAGGTVLMDRYIANLKQGNPRVRQRSARLLGLSKDTRVVEPLISALGDDDGTVRDLAAESLAKVTGKDFGKDQAKWRAWWKENPRTTAPQTPTPAKKPEAEQPSRAEM